MNAPIADEKLNQLIQQIYDAALDDMLWTSVINNIGQAVSAWDNLLFSPRLLTEDSLPFQLSTTFRAGADLWNAYTSYYWQHDIWTIETIKQNLLYGGNVVHGDQLIARKQFQQTEIYRDFYKPAWGVEVVMCSILFDESTPEQSPPLHLSFFKPAAEAFTQQDERLIRYLQPHLQRALHIRWKLANEQLNRQWRELALEQLAVAVILLDEAGRMLFANQKAEALLHDGGNPTVRNGCLCGLDGYENSAIMYALRQAKNGVGSTLKLSNLQPIGTRIATFSPLSIAQSERFATPTRILIMITEPDKPVVGNLDAFAKLYRLTGAEVRVLRHLLQQQSTREIAETLHISIKTLRTQLSALFAKTNTKSQRELVRFYFSHPIGSV